MVPDVRRERVAGCLDGCNGPIQIPSIGHQSLNCILVNKARNPHQLVSRRMLLRRLKGIRSKQKKNQVEKELM